MALGNTESGLMTDEGLRAEDFNEIYESSPVEPKQETVSKWALRDRLRSRVLWAAVAGLIVVVVSEFGLWEKIGITSEGFCQIVEALGAVMAAFGILNDPTNREGF